MPVVNRVRHHHQRSSPSPQRSPQRPAHHRRTPAIINDAASWVMQEAAGKRWCVHEQQIG